MDRTKETGVLLQHGKIREIKRLFCIKTRIIIFPFLEIRNVMF